MSLSLVKFHSVKRNGRWQNKYLCSLCGNTKDMDLANVNSKKLQSCGCSQIARPKGFTIQFAGYKTPCWLWDGVITHYGYGLWSSGKLAHREIFRISYGRYPEQDLDHLCRNRNCVNPNHLEDVSRKINTRRGLLQKLPESAYEQIKQRRLSGERCQTIADDYGICSQYVSQIALGRYRRG